MYEPIVPSTHRPNYSRLPTSHGNNPSSRTVKFLREASLDNSANSPQDAQDYNNGVTSNFRPSLELNSLSRSRPSSTTFSKWAGNKNREVKLEETAERTNQNSNAGRSGNNVIAFGKVILCASKIYNKKDK